MSIAVLVVNNGIINIVKSVAYIIGIGIIVNISEKLISNKHYTIYKPGV